MNIGGLDAFSGREEDTWDEPYFQYYIIGKREKVGVREREEEINLMAEIEKKNRRGFGINNSGEVREYILIAM